MAIIRSDNNGNILQVVQDRDVQLRIAPANTVFELELDQETNNHILDGMAQSVDGYNLIGSTLTLDGQAITVNSPTTERQRLIAARDANLSNPLVTGDYSSESALIQELAEKIAWLEQEIRVLHTLLNLT